MVPKTINIPLLVLAVALGLAEPANAQWAGSGSDHRELDGTTVVAVGVVRRESEAVARGQTRQWLRFKERQRGPATCFGYSGDLGGWVFAEKAALVLEDPSGARRIAVFEAGAGGDRCANYRC